MRGAGAWLAAVLCCVGCGDPQLMYTMGSPGSKQGEWTPPEPKDRTDPRLRIQIDRMLARVSKRRELEPKRVVEGKLLERDEVARLLFDKNEKELPRGVILAQAELMRSFGLIPPDYDFDGGLNDLLQDNLAGFYDQDTDKMYLIDDLGEDGARDTLAHELVHALQDQYFDLAGMLEYRPGEADAITAAHALAEGDAMSAMLDVTLGDAFKVSGEKLRVVMVASVAFSSSGAQTPRVLQASLVAPYTDGFRFVQALRARGGWDAVNEAYHVLPKTTEQLLHLDKYDAREPALDVPAPALDAEWKRADADVLGEQGLRMIFEQWGVNKAAAAAAAGWGGDRFLVAYRQEGDGEDWRAAWVVRFDSEDEAAEAEAFVGAHHANAHHAGDCIERPNLGPFAYRRQRDALAFVGGPYHKAKDGALTAKATCADARAWLGRLL